MSNYLDLPKAYRLGRRNTTYLSLAIYAGVFYYFYARGKRNGRKLEAEKVKQKPHIAQDALARAGLL